MEQTAVEKILEEETIDLDFEGGNMLGIGIVRCWLDSLTR